MRNRNPTASRRLAKAAQSRRAGRLDDVERLFELLDVGSRPAENFDHLFIVREASARQVRRSDHLSRSRAIDRR